MTLGCEAKEIVQYLHVRHFRQLCGKHTRKSPTYKVEHNFSHQLSNIFLNHSFSISVVFSVTHFYSLLIFLHYLFLAIIHLIKSKPRLKKLLQIQTSTFIQTMRSVSALRKLSTMHPASALPTLPTMQPASVLRSLRSIKPTTLEEAPELVPKFNNIVLSPNTQTMMLKKFAGTFVW